MKILMLYPHDIFSPSEPWSTRIVNLAKQIRNNGHEVKLAFCPLLVDGEKEIYIDGIAAVALSRKAGLKSLFSNIAKLKAVAVWADIIHFQKCFHYISLPALIWGFFLNKPLHYDWDDWEEKIWYYSNKTSVHTVIFGNFIRLLERIIPKLADTVSVSSDKLREICVSSGVESRRIFKVPVGADLQMFNPRVSGEEVRNKYDLRNKIAIIYVGQLHGAQYVKMLIEAASIVLHKRSGVVFLIIGKGYMSEELNRLAKKLGIENEVIFTGPVSHELIPKYIACADMCVAPFENNEVTICKSPLKIVEYMSSGKAIVASSVGEVKEMLQDAGMLVRPGNAHSLAKGILDLLGDRNLMDDLGKLARQRAENKYNWEESCSVLLEAYKAGCSGVSQLRDV